MILFFLVIVLAAFGWHTLSMWLTSDFHPVRIVAELLALGLIYHLARKLIDRIGKGQSQ